MHPGLQRVIAFLILCASFGAAVWTSEIGRFKPTTQLAQAAASSPARSVDKGILCGPGELYKVIIEAEDKKDSQGTIIAKVHTDITKSYPKWFCREQVVNKGKKGCQTRRCCRDGKCGIICPINVSSDQEFMNFCQDYYCQGKKGKREYDFDYLKNCYFKGAPANSSLFFKGADSDEASAGLTSINSAAMFSSAAFGVSRNVQLASANGNIATTLDSDCEKEGGTCVWKTMKDAMKNHTKSKSPPAQIKPPATIPPKDPFPFQDKPDVKPTGPAPLQPDLRPREIKPEPPAQPPHGSSAGGKIEEIAKGPPASKPPPDYGSGAGRLPAPAPTYAPSGLLNDFGGISGGLPSGGGGGSSGSGQGGGSIAYVRPSYYAPYAPYAPSAPGISPAAGPGGPTNTTFESLSSQVTFPKENPDTYELIARLSGRPLAQGVQTKTRAQVGTKVVDPVSGAPRLQLDPGEDASVVRSPGRAAAGFVENVRDVISGISDFFVSMFSPRGSGSESLAAEAEGKEAEAGSSAGERTRLVLNAEPEGNILVPGDPTFVLKEVPEGIVLLQYRDPFRGPAPSAPGSGSAAPTPAETIAAIAEGPPSASGGETALAEDAPAPRSEISALGDTTAPDLVAERPEEPAGVVATIRKTVGDALSAVGAGIKAGLSRLFSWF
ncbi:hypothetical protein A2766_03270 [Candidatus Kaiserbacteria bacterium RIFCSPHIGHO2_01_FULL_58_22]|uniref:Uncharacterized protein n=1 Tax=Candidatus Kaiserbacteria bacterium GW2011_GWA2_58_9 TaxID=1618672 RepID=A0A0G1YSV2_9BACT|nr:MAG: hypothetical protein UY98_C0027G0002 [Candidatus Kaiserbacteria bacterium GW2011_GWA2_58_9]OGG62842.1 MAG: hypothetical protein A2766_03270 [Candidatus Kaiserbacteria bacterium RIFCSPHIGHO2_01_FULL_58_22]